MNNTANLDGGGLYSLSGSKALTFAGTKFIGNHAVASGGGLYLNMATDSVAITDSSSFKEVTIAETAHPYIGLPPKNGQAQIIYSVTVNLKSADSILLVFDSKTNVNVQDTFYIYDVFDPDVRSFFLALL
jgi:hypothetical protein